MSTLSHQHHLLVFSPAKRPWTTNGKSWIPVIKSSMMLDKSLTYLESQFFTLQHGCNFHSSNQLHTMQFQRVFESILKSTEDQTNVQHRHWLTMLRIEIQAAPPETGLSPPSIWSRPWQGSLQTGVLQCCLLTGTVPKAVHADYSWLHPGCQAFQLNKRNLRNKAPTNAHWGEQNDALLPVMAAC